jgi:pSer/pThr/pTyr-binding forkhead associated (FHA) protein
MATLFIASGENDGGSIPIGKKTMVLGRDEALLAQLADPHISRKHLTIRYDQVNHEYIAVDMKSRNGAFVNNVPVEDEVVLKSDDLIRIGDTLLLFVDQDFDGDDNAMNFYKKRGQRDVDTLDMNRKSMDGFAEDA